MKELYFATTNKGKLYSFQRALQYSGIEVIHLSLDLPEPRSDNLQEIAQGKVEYAFKQIHKPCVAIDSGFYIHSLNGFPRAFVNFALDTVKVEGILKLIEEKDRDCEFRNCLAFTDGESINFFETIEQGMLSHEPQGNLPEYAWSDLFTIFIPTGYEKTLAEMTHGEYKEWRRDRKNDSVAEKLAQWLR